VSAGDFVQPVHFRELHYLPRVIFSIGAVLLVGSFFVKNIMVGSTGVAVIFSASFYNLTVDTILEWSKQRKPNWIMLIHCVIALVLALGTIYITRRLYQSSQPPECSQPYVVHPTS